MALPELVAVQTKPLAPMVIEENLLTQIAEETNAVSWKDLRWFVVGKVPRSIVVVKRGTKPVQTVCTISKTNNPEGWSSWQPVLAEWLAEKEKTNGKRVNHEKLQKGKI